MRLNIQTMASITHIVVSADCLVRPAVPCRDCNSQGFKMGMFKTKEAAEVFVKHYMDTRCKTCNVPVSIVDKNKLVHPNV